MPRGRITANVRVPVSSQPLHERAQALILAQPRFQVERTGIGKPARGERQHQIEKLCGIGTKSAFEGVIAHAHIELRNARVLVITHGLNDDEPPRRHMFPRVPAVGDP